MLIDKLLSSPMYPTPEMSKQSKKNNWYVREKGSDQPYDQSWRAWWESRLLGDAHIKWRSTCIARNAPDPFNPPRAFDVDFKAPDGKIYHLEFTLAPHGPNK
ncbi:hypothetical protein [Cronobacter turicensis]|uniref:hypothetical protein n=1 Tax=Cronobacter turicensis TaxID=413502 RepID=UPI0035710842